MLYKEISICADKLNAPCVTKASLWVYFAESIKRSLLQEAHYGKCFEEFWIIYTAEPFQIIGFGHWFKAGNPYTDTAVCDMIYSSIPEATGLLCEEYVGFGKRLDCKHYLGECRSRALARLFTIKFKKYGVSFTPTDKIQVLGE